jgi:PAS domain S-box-containing protein
MNYDIIVDTKLNPNSLQADLQQLPGSIFSILNSVTEPLILLDTKFIIAFINEAANAIVKRISGNCFEPGESILNLLKGEQQTNLKKQLEQALRGKYVQHQVKILNNNGGTYLECLYKPLDSGYGINGISTFFKEANPIKDTEEKGRKKKQEEKRFHGNILFESFMENTPLSAWITDGKGIIHYLNPAFRKLYNLPLDDLSRTMDEIFPQDLSDEYKENNLLALKSGQMIEVVERTLKPDGNMAIYRVFKFPMAINGETMIGGWSIEITEETKLQEQLTNSIERYSFVNEATSDAIYDWDTTDNVLYRGKGFAILFGYHDPYVPLVFRFSRIHPADVERVKKTYLGVLEDATHRRWKLKYRLKDAKGLYKNVVDKAFIIRENGRVVRVIGAIQDITEYNQLQEKLVLQEESKKRAIVRSIIETQEKERRQLSVELHDNVNQILSSCKLMLELAKENKDKAPLLTEKSYQSIQLAITEIRKISHNLNPSAVEDFGLREAITEMVDKINLSEKVKIDFKFSATAKKTPLKSEDKIAVYRIVQEQINNILKHAHAKNVFIDLTIKPLKIHLFIEDDGNGFNPKKINKGIGLKNIHHRVEYYHGTIAIESGKNKGCKMTITLNISSVSKK